MKRFMIPFLLLGLLGAQASAQCRYFKISARILKCTLASAAAYELKNPYHQTLDMPELEEASAPSVIEVTCECTYSLSGADPLCDVDQTVEKSSVLGTNDPLLACRPGNLLCRDVCPRTLP